MGGLFALIILLVLFVFLTTLGVIGLGLFLATRAGVRVARAGLTQYAETRRQRSNGTPGREATPAQAPDGSGDEPTPSG